MAEPSPAWKVHDTSPLHRLEDNLWEVDGSLPKMPLRHGEMTQADAPAVMRTVAATL